MGRYYTQSLGETLQGLKIFKQPTSVLEILKWNWSTIMPDLEFAPTKYFARTKTLTISAKLPAIYIQHLADPIKTRCNNFLGHEAVEKVRFTTA